VSWCFFRKQYEGVQWREETERCPDSKPLEPTADNYGYINSLFILITNNETIIRTHLVYNVNVSCRNVVQGRLYVFSNCRIKLIVATRGFPASARLFLKIFLNLLNERYANRSIRYF